MLMLVNNYFDFLHEKKTENLLLMFIEKNESNLRCKSTKERKFIQLK